MKQHPRLLSVPSASLLDVFEAPQVFLDVTVNMHRTNME